MVITKQCTKCKRLLPLDNFQRQSKNADGLRYACKQCVKAMNDARYRLRQDEILETVKDWQSKNRPKVLGIKKKYRDKLKSRPEQPD